MKKVIGIRTAKLIDSLVEYYRENQAPFKNLVESLNAYVENSKELKDLIHSKKYRIKDPEHLRDKLERKWQHATKNGVAFDYTKANLFAKINDLAGFRILHLHNTQFEKINIQLKKIFEEQQWSIIEGPDARTWDDETREYFSKIGVATSANPNMYTSVHYIVKPNSSSPISCEIQVRTLMEEVWGEVDHLINYPHKSDSHSCREQIKTLARVTSSCSRLVDSIFSTHEHEASKVEIAVKQATKPK
jgi:putative GTP pyrophosphokinase